MPWRLKYSPDVSPGPENEIPGNGMLEQARPVEAQTRPGREVHQRTVQRTEVERPDKPIKMPCHGASTRSPQHGSERQRSAGRRGAPDGAMGANLGLLAGGFIC